METKESSETQSEAWKGCFFVVVANAHTLITKLCFRSDTFIFIVFDSLLQPCKPTPSPNSNTHAHAHTSLLVLVVA